MATANKKRAWQAAQKVPLARLNVVSAIFRAVSWWLDRFLGMKSPHRASCSGKRANPCPGLAIRFPVPYTFLTGLPYCRGGISGQLPAF